MGKRIGRLTYSPPEKFGADDRIGHGEVASMITDLLDFSGERYFLRRRIDNHLRYAVKQKRLSRSLAGTYLFAEVAAWAVKRYREGNPGILRMRHGVTVLVRGTEASSQVGAPNVYGSMEDYKIGCKRLTRENERLASEVTEIRKQAEILRRDAEIGRKVREGSMKGGLAPKCP
jgi:hypothetical protein